MLRECTREELLSSLRWGDIVIVKGKSLMAKGEYLLNNVDGVDVDASHGAIVKTPPQISEAMFSGITDKNKITRYLGGDLTVWVFRYCRPLTPEEIALGETYLAARDNETPYGKKGIGQFIKRFFLRLVGRNYTPKDKPGVFCTEHSSDFIKAMRTLCYLEAPSEQITPSVQLDYFCDTPGTWPLAALYDGRKYYIAA
jgi:hypothetical protein